MKHLKAYTFEELLCEIPDLEKYKNAYEIDLMDKEIQSILRRFCRANKFKCAYTQVYIFENKTHFLFEKL